MTIASNWFSYGADSSAPKSSDFGLVVTCENPYESSERDRTIYSVPGRNGDIIIDNGRYANVSVTYTVNLLNVTPAKIDAIREWLLTPITYQRIYDSYDTTCYREGIFAGNIGWTLTQLQRHGSASITFNCKPQRWLVSGDTPILIDFEASTKGTLGWTVKLTNPTNMPAYPYVVITALGINQGVRIVYFRDGDSTPGAVRQQISIESSNIGGLYPEESTLDFFSAIYKDIYADGTAVNLGALGVSQDMGGLVSAALPPGPSYISFFLTPDSDGVTAEIYPRWWKL